VIIAKNIFVDYSDASSGFWYNYSIGSWITIDFSPNKVSLEHYTIRAWGQDFMPNWIVEGSDDNSYNFEINVFS